MLTWKEIIKTKKGLKTLNGQELMKKATVVLLKEMMPMTKMMLKEMKFSDMMIITGDDGLIYAVHRAQNYSHNPDRLVLLSPKHPYTKLILKSFHDINHRGVAYTVARSRLRYWIPQATKMEDDQNGRRPKWKTTKMEDD